MTDWSVYYAATREKPPSPLLVEALTHCTKPRTALDLGAGALRDSILLLQKGLWVTAVDSSPQILDYARELKAPNLTVRQATFAEYEFPVNTFDLITAQWSLPFCAPDDFADMFARLKRSLRTHGIFTAQFFGPNDAWNTPDRPMSFHTREQIEELLKGWRIISMDEEEKDGKTAVGVDKHWHVFHVIAEKEK